MMKEYAKYSLQQCTQKSVQCTVHGKVIWLATVLKRKRRRKNCLREPRCTKLCTVQSTMYCTIQCAVLWSVKCTIVLVEIYTKQGNSFSSLNMSGQTTTLMSGYSVMDCKVYSVQYSVHCTIQYRVGVWGFQVLSGLLLYSL